MPTKRVMPTLKKTRGLEKMAREIVKTTEGMVNYLEKAGFEEIDYNEMLLWSDLKTIGTLAEPIVSILAVIANRDNLKDDPLSAEEGVCPGCGSINFTHGPYDDESGCLQRDCECHACGHQFRQFFVFDGTDDAAE